MADVFISYAREDRPRAEEIARALQAMGLESFWDTEIPPGQTWADYIEGKLSGCKAVIVLWSEHSTKSQWVREEARMGRDRGRLIPVMLDNSTMPFGFGEVQAADLSRWRGEPNHPDWTRLSNAVYSAVRGADAPRPPPPQAQAAWSPPPPAQSARPAPAAAPGEVENLSPIGYVQKCFRLYANGKGRARRAEYWWWALFVFVASFAAGFLDATLSGVNPMTNSPNSQILSSIVGLGILAPGVAVTSRRFHDVGLSGWWVAGVYAAIFVGAVMATAAMALGALLVLGGLGAALVIALLPSKPGENQYGPNPKGL